MFLIVLKHVLTFVYYKCFMTLNETPPCVADMPVSGTCLGYFREALEMVVCSVLLYLKTVVFVMSALRCLDAPVCAQWQQGDSGNKRKKYSFTFLSLHCKSCQSQLG